MKLFYSAFLACAVLALPSAALAQPGSLDTSFSGDGRATTDFSPGAICAAVAIQADGKIVVGGTSAWNSRNPMFALVRYNADGTLDTTFGGDGRVTTDFTPTEDGVYGVAIQADGKIVASGDAGVRSTDSRFAVARYNADGTLDTSFGGDGKVTTEFTPRDDPVAGLVIQTDGKILLSGGAGWNSFNPRIALARFNSDGTLDTTFGGDGRVTTDVTKGDEYANAVAVQADGKIVAGGFAPQAGSGSFALVRYASDGSPDPTFSGDGIVLTNFTRRATASRASSSSPTGGSSPQASPAAAAPTRGSPSLATAPTGRWIQFSGNGTLMTDFTQASTRPWTSASRQTGRSSSPGGHRDKAAGSR